jgi:hypothetical protein
MPCRGYLNPNNAEKPDKADMGKPFGKASTCLRVAASAKAGANLYTKRHAPSLNKLEFIRSEILRSHKQSQNARLPKSRPRRDLPMSGVQLYG